MMTLGTDKRLHRCWLLGTHGFQCHLSSAYVVKVGSHDKIMSCGPHLAKAVKMAGGASGQSADKPMIIVVATIPKPLPPVQHVWPRQAEGCQ